MFLQDLAKCQQGVNKNSDADLKTIQIHSLFLFDAIIEAYLISYLSTVVYI